MHGRSASAIPRLCKYRSMEEGKTREYTLAILKTLELRYSPASTFNDPFDCNLDIALKSTEEVKVMAEEAVGRGRALMTVALQKLREWMESKGVTLPPPVVKAPPADPTPEPASEATGKRKSAARLVIRQQGADGRWRGVPAGELYNRIGREMMVEKYPLLDRSFGVLCLSERPDDFLLWSHYGSNHSGLVLEFDAGGHPAAFPRLHKVVYQRAYPAIPAEFPVLLRTFTDKETGLVTETLLNLADVLANQLSSNAAGMTRETSAALSLARWFYVKSSVWKYEREWRCLKWQPGSQAFPPAALTRIIAGCTRTDETLALVRDAIAGTAIKDVPLFKAVRKAHRFGLDIVPAA